MKMLLVTFSMMVFMQLCLPKSEHLGFVYKLISKKDKGRHNGVLSQELDWLSKEKEKAGVQ
jgi:inner membrane protein involved in colicin E2 resistance